MKLKLLNNQKDKGQIQDYWVYPDSFVAWGINLVRFGNIGMSLIPANISSDELKLWLNMFKQDRFDKANPF